MHTGADPSKGFNEREQYLTVVTSCLGQHTMLYCAGLDGVNTSKSVAEASLDAEAFVELTTVKLRTEPDLTEHPNGTMKMHKFRDWWAQSYLSGTNNIVCGFKDENSVVRKIKLYDLDELVRNREVRITQV